MKKLIFAVTVLALFSVVFTACGRSERDYIHVQPQLSSLTGILTEMEPAAHPSATHIITREDRVEFPVKSLAIDLSSERYLGNAVEATGVMDTSNNVFEVSGITNLEVLLSEPELEPDPTDETEEDVDEEDVDENDFVEEPPAEIDPDTDDLPEIDMELTYFESLPYFFRGVYPSQWYYAGSLPISDGVLHHYGFSDEPVTRENEILSLDVIDGSLLEEETSARRTESLFIDEREFKFYSTSSEFSVYTTVEGRHYRVSGPPRYSDLMLNMAAGITPFDPNDR